MAHHRTGQGGEKRYWKFEINFTEHDYERTENIAAFASMRKMSKLQQQIESRHNQHPWFAAAVLAYWRLRASRHARTS